MKKEVDLLLFVGGEWQSIDIDKSTVLALTYQRTDLNNPTAIKNTFSTSINLPKTNTNNDIFDHIGNVQHTVNRFNPLERTEFMLYVNGSLYESGYIDLEAITDDNYSIRLYGGLFDYFFTLNETKLKELAVGNTFDHTISKESIYANWNTGNSVIVDGSGNEALTYVMTYQGQYENFDSDSIEKSIISTSGSVQSLSKEEVKWADVRKESEEATYSRTNPELTEHRRNGRGYGTTSATPDSNYFGEYRSYYQKPALRMKVLFNKMFSFMEQEGWTTIKDEKFFNNNNPYWEDLYCLVNNYATSDDLSELNSASFDSFPTPSTIAAGSNINSTTQSNMGRYMGFKPTILNKVTATIQFDLFGTYSSILLGLTKNGTLKVGVELLIGSHKIKLYTPDGEDRLILGPSTVSPIPTSAGSVTRWAYHKVGAASNTFEFTGSGYIPENTVASYPYIIVNYIFEGDTRWTASVVRDTGVSISPTGGSVTISEMEVGGLRSKSNITWNDIIQSDTTCMEFLLSYSKLFDLHFIKNVAKKEVTIMSRNTFFGGKEILDWTDKVDYSREFKVEPTPFAYKRGIFKWQDLGTKYENKYLANRGVEYGSFRLNTNNKISTEDKEYLEDNIFGNCVVGPDYSQYYAGRGSAFRDNKELPILIDSSDSRVDVNFTLLFKGEPTSLTTGDKTYPVLITDDTSTMGETQEFYWQSTSVLSLSKYLPMRRVFVKNNTLYSLNFGRPDIVYSINETNLYIEYPLIDGIGEETLYYKFWRGYLHDRISSNCKQVTCYIDMDITDIAKNLLRKFIVINNVPFVIEKISQFNPMDNNPTKVVLMSIQNMDAYVSQVLE